MTNASSFQLLDSGARIAVIVAHNDISIIASNADNWYNDGKDTFPDRDLDGKDDRATRIEGFPATPYNADQVQKERSLYMK